MVRKAKQKRDWISVGEAAEILGLSHRRTLELVADGRLRGQRINPRLWLVEAASAHEEAQNERPPGRPPKIA